MYRLVGAPRGGLKKILGLNFDTRSYMVAGLTGCQQHTSPGTRRRDSPRVCPPGPVPCVRLLGTQTLHPPVLLCGKRERTASLCCTTATGAVGIYGCTDWAASLWPAVLGSIVLPGQVLGSEARLQCATPCLAHAFVLCRTAALGNVTCPT